MLETILVVCAGAVLLLNVGTTVKMLLTLDKLQRAAEVNASNVEAIQEAAKVVAADLAARSGRADAIDGMPGEAADTAARSDPLET